MTKKQKNNWLNLPVASLVKADWNYKTDDAEKAAKLKSNIERNGQLENIIVRELPDDLYEVVNGNHRLSAFQDIGTPTVVCYNLGPISIAKAKRVAIETNETRFETDSIKLAELLKSLVEGPDAEFEIAELATSLPYTEVDIEDRIKLLSFDWSQFKEHAPEEKENDPKKEITCPECGHAFKID